MKRIVVGAVLALALVAVACGCGSTQSSSAGIGPRLDRICRTLAAEERAIGEPVSFLDLATKGPRLLRALDGAMVKVGALARRFRSSAADRFVSRSVELRDVLGRIYAAAQRGDVATAQRLAGRAGALNGELNELAGNELGAPACASG